MSKIIGFALAGGKSSRMGQNKAFMQLEGRTLLELALTNLKSVTPNVAIVGDARIYGALGSVVEDEFPNCGPLGGIHAALKSSSSESNLILAVDLACMQASFLTFMIEQANNFCTLITVPEIDGRLQPLCAVYPCEFWRVAEKALAQGKYKITALFNESNTNVIEEEELKRHGFSSQLFININTPSDWQQVEAAMERQS